MKKPRRNKYTRWPAPAEQLRQPTWLLVWKYLRHEWFEYQATADLIYAQNTIPILHND